MYLFSRRARLAGGHGTKGVEWAVAMCERVHQTAGMDVNLWATAYSAGVGTISWTTFLPDLAALEALSDKLQADAGYIEATVQGAAFLDGGVDDVLLQIVAGQPDPGRDVEYVSATVASCTNGHFADGVGVGIEIAERAEAVTGLPTMFVRNMTGAYAGVGWLSGFVDINQLETAETALAADPGWVAFLDDKAADVYVQDPATTVSTIYRKLA